MPVMRALNTIRPSTTPCVAAGALERENQVVAPFTLVAGVPARFVRTFDPVTRRHETKAHAAGYVARAREHAAGQWPWTPG